MSQITFESLKGQIQELNIGINIKLVLTPSSCNTTILTRKDNTGREHIITDFLTFPEMQSFINGYWFCLKNPKKYQIIDAIDVQLPKMYQPKDAGTGDSCFSFEVWHHKENAQKDYPNSEIIEYNWGDIENPTFIDQPLIN